MWRAIYRAGAAFRLRFGSGHSSARQRDKSRATGDTDQQLRPRPSGARGDLLAWSTVVNGKSLF